MKKKFLIFNDLDISLILFMGYCVLLFLMNCLFLNINELFLLYLIVLKNATIARLLQQI